MSFFLSLSWYGKFTEGGRSSSRVCSKSYSSSRQEHKKRDVKKMRENKALGKENKKRERKS